MKYMDKDLKKLFNVYKTKVNSTSLLKSEKEELLEFIQHKFNQDYFNENNFKKEFDAKFNLKIKQSERTKELKNLINESDLEPIYKFKLLKNLDNQVRLGKKPKTNINLKTIENESNVNNYVVKNVYRTYLPYKIKNDILYRNFLITDPDIIQIIIAEELSSYIKDLITHSGLNDYLTDKEFNKLILEFQSHSFEFLQNDLKISTNYYPKEQKKKRSYKFNEELIFLNHIPLNKFFYKGLKSYITKTSQKNEYVINIKIRFYQLCIEDYKTMKNKKNTNNNLKKYNTSKYLKSSDLKKPKEKYVKDETSYNYLNEHWKSEKHKPQYNRNYNGSYGPKKESVIEKLHRRV